MENNNQNINEKLNRLIDIAENGKEGYENAAKDIKDNAVKKSFLLFAGERSTYASQLRETVHQLNGEAEDDGGDAKGSMHRAWMDVKAIFTSGDTEAIINACITGEEAAVKEYESVLDDSTFPENRKPLIRKQLNGIEQALNTIRSHVNN